MTAPGISEKMPARLLPSQAFAQMRPRDARDSGSLSHVRSPENREWETKPKVENLSSVSPKRPETAPSLHLRVDCGAEELRGCRAQCNRYPTCIPCRQPPAPATLRTRSSGASRCELRLAARHAMEHPLADTLRRRPGCFRQAAPTVPSCPGFSPLLAPIPKRKVLASSLRA